VAFQYPEYIDQNPNAQSQPETNRGG